MSKVLITYLSKLTSKNTISYSTEDSGVIDAYYTNEAGVKYFAEREDTKDIDTIIAVCSPEVMKKSDIDVSISAFEDFSDSITLGKIENLDGRFSDLAEKINDCEKHLGKSQDEKILGEMLPIISKKFFGETGNTDYFMSFR